MNRVSCLSEFLPESAALYISTSSSKQYQVIYVFYDLPKEISPGHLNPTKRVGWTWKGTTFLHDSARNEELAWSQIIGRIYLQKEKFQKALVNSMESGKDVHTRSGFMTTWEEVSPGKIRVKAVHQDHSKWVTLDIASQDRLVGPDDFTLLRLTFDPKQGKVLSSNDQMIQIKTPLFQNLPELCQWTISGFLYDSEAEKLLKYIFSSCDSPQKELEKWTTGGVHRFCGRKSTMCSLLSEAFDEVPLDGSNVKSMSIGTLSRQLGSLGYASSAIRQIVESIDILRVHFGLPNWFD